jgi:hypothetical protein
MIIRNCSLILGTYSGVRRAAAAQQRGGDLAYLGSRGDAEVGEPGFQQGEGPADRFRAARCCLEPHDALVEELVVGVVGERGFEGGEGLVGVAGPEDLGDGGPGVQGAAAGCLGMRPGPLVSGALGKLAVVEPDGGAAGGQPGGAAGGAAGLVEGASAPGVGARMASLSAVLAGRAAQHGCPAR